MKKTILKLTTSALFLYLTFRQVEFDKVGEILKDSKPEFFFLMAVLIILNYVFSSIRWRKLFLDTKVVPNLAYMLRLYFKGSFFNNFLPTSIGGDSYKVFKLSKRTGDPVNAFASTFMDRFTGFVILVFISYIGFIFTYSQWFSLLRGWLTSDLLVYAVLITCVLGFWVGTISFFIIVKLLAPKIAFADKLLKVFLQYKVNKAILIWSLVTSVVVQLIAIFTQYFSFVALGSVPNIFYSLFVIPIITLAGFFIPSINGFGVQDYLFVRLFEPAGIPEAVAISASLAYHFFRLVVSVIGGVFYAVDKD